MFTNTFTPHVGGVARSVEAFARHYRELGHRVLVVAPEFKDMPSAETGVLRVPALQNFNGGDFSVVLPVSGLLNAVLDDFQPTIVHSHHPYLLGMTALRIARYRNLPLVFTHHTLYEQYTHYVPGNSLLLKRFAVELATEYANLADCVFAPSESIRDLIQRRGVTTPISVIPTGVELARFESSGGAKFRRAMNIPEDAFVVGHLGRLAPEKNLEFLARAVVDFIRAATIDSSHDVHFLLVGKGPEETTIKTIFAAAGLLQRLHIAGLLQWQQLADAYHAMDVFAFSSKSETQGMVLTEAMAAGVPVVALDAPGAREVVEDNKNGRLLPVENRESFAAALKWVADQTGLSRTELRNAALATADAFSMPHSAEKALRCYARLQAGAQGSKDELFESWGRLLDLIKAEWDIIGGIMEGATSAAAASLSGAQPDDPTG